MRKRISSGLKGLPVKGGGKMSQRQMQQVSNMLPPQMLNQMGGMNGLKVLSFFANWAFVLTRCQKMMKDMGGGGLLGNLGGGGGGADDGDDDDDPKAARARKGGKRK